MIRRTLCALFALVLSFASVPALAQSDTGEIDIDVTDAATKSPVVLARVLLDGPVIASEYTGNNGRVRFTDVPSGIYHARVFARGYQAVTSEQFEITNGRVVGVTVALAPSTNQKVIATVVSHSAATISTTSVSNDGPQRKLSDSLADAVGKLSGVTVSTSSSDTDATQTISLEGHDPSQTQLTLDGIPLNAPGTAGDLRQIGTDLFTGASVSFGPQLGGLGGGVNFRTLDPTLSWQSSLTATVGSYGKDNMSFAETGSYGKLGVALMHSFRDTPSYASGLVYTDASGFTYSHVGDSTNDGTMAKLRYNVGQNQTFIANYLDSGTTTDLLCLQDTGPLPCGYGPGNVRDGHFRLYSLTDSALFGDTALQAAIYGTQSTTTNDMLQRYVNGEAAPTGTTSSYSTRGFSLNATLPEKERHTLSVQAFATSTTSQFTPLVAQAVPYTYPGQSTSYTSLALTDTIASSPQLRLTQSIGLNRATGSGGSALASFGATWKPTGSDTYAASYSIGGNAPHAGRNGTLSDPAQLRFDCNGDIAYGNAPGDVPGASSSNSARVSYSHRLRAGVGSVSLYRQTQNGVVLPAQVNASELLSSGLFPPDYFSGIQQVFRSPAGCGVPTAFLPQQLYLNMPVAGVQRVYQGAQFSGFFTLGNLVAQPYYNIQSSTITSNDPRLNNPYSITIPGNQVPNVPLHRAGLTLDYKAPHSALEWLASANYTSRNNAQNLPAYTTVDAGVSAQLPRGTLTLAATNVFNAFGGVFASSANAVPYSTEGGALVPTIARPNAPRQVAFTYTARFGQNVTPPAARALSAPTEGARGSGPGEGRGFFQPLPPAPPADPFAVSSSAACTAQARQTVEPMLSALRSYVAGIDAQRTAAGYPQSVAPAQIPGVIVVYHPLGQTYALTISPTASADRTSLRTLFGCLQLYVAQPEQVQQRSLFVAPGLPGLTRPTVTYMPGVGLYVARRAPQTGAENFRVYKLPATAPVQPFALRTGASTCTPQATALARQYFGELERHFASNALARDWAIAAHQSSAGTWYSLDVSDVAVLEAIVNCGRVAAATTAELHARGWDGAAPPTLNYAKPLGLYFATARPFGAPPSPRPSARP